MRVGRERRIGEEEEEQRSLLETGGEGGRSSKKDLLLPHTAADISAQFTIMRLSSSSSPLLFSPNYQFNPIIPKGKGDRVRVAALFYYKYFITRDFLISRPKFLCDSIKYIYIPLLDR